MYSLYMIFCKDDVIYIGISANINHRIRTHFRRGGSSVTKVYKPIGYSILGVFKEKEEAMKEEKSTVMELRSNGYRAYGGPYTNISCTDTFFKHRPLVRYIKIVNNKH